MTEDGLAEKFETARMHLDYVDRTLDEIAGEIENMINEALTESTTTVSYDLDSGTIEGRMPIDEVTSRVNRRLEPPFYVKYEEGAIVISDIRTEFDISELESGYDLQASRGRKMTVRKLIGTIEENYDGGAPVDEIITLLIYMGLSEEDAKNQIEGLKRKGELYEPTQGHLRTT